MTIMKKLFVIVGAWLYAILVSIILGVIVYYLAPWVMKFTWQQFFMYFLIGAVIIFGLIEKVSNLLMTPLIKLMNICKHAKWLAGLSFLINGIYWMIFPWTLEGVTYGLRQIVLSICLSMFCISIHYRLISSTFTFTPEDQD